MSADASICARGTITSLSSVFSIVVFLCFELCDFTAILDISVSASQH